MYIMFSTPLTCCSIGAATVSATTWALAPGYWQVTLTVGGAIGGYIAMGRVPTARPPAGGIAVHRDRAEIGGAMKKRGEKGGTRALGGGGGGGRPARPRRGRGVLAWGVGPRREEGPTVS